uniref:Regulator of G protein signaling 17 n=1 Tax=Neolamprologus brichardi TaxID=32507 RepID=A0A3Q4MSJ0_NEOBR
MPKSSILVLYDYNTFPQACSESFPESFHSLATLRWACICAFSPLRHSVRPSLEEVLSWARSFEMMLRSLEGREVFRQFLRSEYSEDNLLFWLACEELKKETDPTAVDEKARIIYEDYVSILSPKEVSLDSRVREGINQSLAEPSNLMYEEAQLQIYTLMHRDSFPRFLNSSVYRDLLASRSATTKRLKGKLLPLLTRLGE